MSSYTLPLDTSGLLQYRFQVDFEGATYGFEVRWNGREGAWYLSVVTPDDEVLAVKRVTVGGALLRRMTDGRLPPGELTVVDASGAGTDPGAGELGTRVLIVYTESSDLPEGYARRA